MADKKKIVQAPEGEITPDDEMSIAPYKHESELEDADHQFRVDPTADVVVAEASEAPAEKDTGWVGTHIEPEDDEPLILHDQGSSNIGRREESELIVDGVDNVPQQVAPPGTINPETADEDPEPGFGLRGVSEVVHYHAYSHEETLFLVTGALKGKAAEWRAKAYEEGFKGAANQQAIQAYTWAAGELEEIAKLVALLPEGEEVGGEEEEEPEE